MTLALLSMLAIKAELRISPSGLMDDLRLARQALEALHPGLYRYQTPAKWQSTIREFERRFDVPLSRGEAYLAFSQLLNRIQCGHSYCNFFNQSEAVTNELLKNPNRIPFYFRWLDGKIVVTRNLSTDTRFKPGTSITAIDGMPVSHIYGKMLTVSRADGKGDSKRRRYLEIDGQGRYEAFDIYLPLLFPEIGQDFTLSATGVDGKRFLTTVPAIGYEQRTVNHALPTGKEALWTVTRPRPDTVYLRMPTWAVFNSKWKWSDWLNTHLDAAASDGTQNLIVDLRGNEGGLDCGDLILARLIDQPLKASASPRYTTYQKTPESLNPYLDTWDKSFRDWGSFTRPEPTPPTVPHDPRAFFRLTRYDDAAGVRVLDPKGAPFRGKTYVLVDAVCSSATFQFAQIVKSNRLATLIGETTGGSQRGINGGAFFFFRMPSSGIEFDIPLIATFPPETQARMPDAGIEPDIRVETTAADIANGRDAQLQRVLTLIAARSK